MKHLRRQSTHPLQIDDYREVPIPTDKHVAEIEIGELKRKGPVAHFSSVAAVREYVKQCSDCSLFSINP